MATEAELINEINELKRKESIIKNLLGEELLKDYKQTLINKGKDALNTELKTIQSLIKTKEDELSAQFPPTTEG